MYAGQIVEIGTSEQVLLEPRHPYTRALLDSRATAAKRGLAIPMIAGVPPNPASVPSGCAFHPRCRIVEERCRTSEPEFGSAGERRYVRCWMSGDADPDLTRAR
jgi:oligopeptide/dipeptide ABC transporter ATP-binding protein